MHSVSANDLKNIIEKIERLEEEKANVSEWIRDAFLEAKVQGFDARILKQVIRMRKMKREDRLEQEELLATYWSALHGAEATPVTEEVA